MKKRVSSGSPLEPIIGFCRAVRTGPHVAIAGTAPIGADGRTVAVGNVTEQANRCLEIIESALTAAGARLEDVTRTRILLTDIDDWDAVAKVHGAVFGSIRPVCTVMQVVRFIDPEWLVEIEVDAVIDDG